MLLLTQHPTDQPSTPAVRPSRAELIARVRALLLEDLEESDRFRTALIFLAGHWTPSIDRLARFAGCERELVARYARRWADHGLWGRAATEADALTPSKMAHALEVSEGLVRHPGPGFGSAVDDAFAEAAEAGEAVGWSAAPEVPVRTGAHLGGLAPTVQSEEGNADTLLSALWDRLGLASPGATTVRRAA